MKNNLLKDAWIVVLGLIVSLPVFGADFKPTDEQLKAAKKFKEKFAELAVEFGSKKGGPYKFPDKNRREFLERMKNWDCYDVGYPVSSQMSYSEFKGERNPIWKKLPVATSGGFFGSWYNMRRFESPESIVQTNLIKRIISAKPKESAKDLVARVGGPQFVVERLKIIKYESGNYLSAEKPKDPKFIANWGDVKKCTLIWVTTEYSKKTAPVFNQRTLKLKAPGKRVLGSEWGSFSSPIFLPFGFESFVTVTIDEKGIVNKREVFCVQLISFSKSDP
jgi:hypothetical protein